MTNLVSGVSSEDLNERRTALAEAVEARYAWVDAPARVAAALVTTAIFIGGRFRARRQPR